MNMQVSHYRLLSLLGQGASGSVYKGIDTSLKHSPMFAIKCVRECRHSAPGWPQQIAEVENHNAVTDCPHVMRLCAFFRKRGYLFFVFPLCKTDMFSAIWRGKVYWKNDGLIRNTFVDILDGVYACHQKGVFHRDLKPENIMCDADGTNIRISDFGLSTNRRVCKDGGCGTPNYMSPECLDERLVTYDAAFADVWSLGVVLYVMVTGRYPWDEARPKDKAYKAFLTKRDHLLRTSVISESLNRLLIQILYPIPVMRLSIAEIRKAVLEIDTFYRPEFAPVSPNKTVVSVAESQETRVNPAEDAKKKDKRCAIGMTLAEETTCSQLALKLAECAQI